jgi:hypothetical protein
MKQKRLPEGITVRHGRSCPAREGKRCRCDPNYQAQVWSARDGKRLSRTFPHSPRRERGAKTRWSRYVRERFAPRDQRRFGKPPATGSTAQLLAQSGTAQAIGTSPRRSGATR